MTRSAPDMNPKVIQSAEEAMDAYVKMFAPLIEYSGGILSPNHLARFMVSHMGEAGWIRKRRASDAEDEIDAEAIKARCGPEVSATALVTDHAPEQETISEAS